MAMPRLQMRLLGGFNLSYDNLPIQAVHSARLHALLAYLLLHRDAPQPRQHLAYLFWPDATELQARSNLRQLPHQFRHVLPGADGFLGYLGAACSIGASPLRRLRSCIR